ncbi:MAG: S9 family peptidase [Bacteroidota bacterium]
MKQSSVLLIIVLMFLSCNETEKPREVKKYSIQQFMENTDIRRNSLSFDEEKVLFTSNKSGIYNVYSVNIKNNEVKQLTHSEKSAFSSYSYFPNDNRILIKADNEGDELYHIFLRKEDGTMKDLTPDSIARALFYAWNYDQKSFIYGSNKRNKRIMDIYEMDIDTFEPTLIYANDSGYSLRAISNDKKYIAFKKTYIRENTDIFLFNRETSELKLLTEHQGNIVFDPFVFSSNNKYLYYKTDKTGEYTYIEKLDIETGKAERAYTEDWDIERTYISHNSKYSYIGINEDACTRIKIFDQNNKQVNFPEFEGSSVTDFKFSKSEKAATFYVSSTKSAGDLYYYNFETKESRQLTNAMNPEIPVDDLVKGKVIRYNSFDNLEIPAILYRPHIASKSKKVPALIWVHGGPGDQSKLFYDPLLQYLVNHDYAILAVNNRGSSGYGKTFFGLDDMKHGEDDLIDCIYGKNYLASTGWVDTTKIGIIGDSYGGYMVLSALAFQPDEFKVGVDVFGVANWLRILQSMPPWWGAYRDVWYKEMGNPETDSMYLHKISPIFHAENIIKPLMVLQGAKDPRVLKVESDEMVEAVKKNGVPVEYVVFDDEGHGFRKKENEIEGYEKILKFLDKYLVEKSEIQEATKE